jgi:hypothetical protein
MQVLFQHVASVCFRSTPSRLLTERKYCCNTAVSTYFTITKRENFTHHVYGLLLWDSLRTSKWLPALQKNVLPASSGLKKKAVCCFKTMASSYKSTRRYNLEEQEMAVFWDVRGACCLCLQRDEWQKFTDVSEVLAVSINRVISGNSVPTFQICLLPP